MPNIKVVLVTGACGGIGRTLVQYLLANGYHVIATDKNEELGFTCHKGTSESLIYAQCNLNDLPDDPSKLDGFYKATASFLSGKALIAIIHNAAYQVVKSFSDLTCNDWVDTFRINVLAPVLISNIFLDELIDSQGSIVHIGSIHSNLTKPGFAAYATSKAALSGLTKAMAVELGGLIRVNAIEPAAIATPMLEAGFERSPHLKAQLESFHPTGSIGTPKDVANVVLFLLHPSNSFLNGCILPLSGGIHSRLHDPA
jgi:NAD(P)-dependent dehydrogenase (short-subunit alcohol dehydrogenase family)